LAVLPAAPEEVAAAGRLIGRTFGEDMRWLHDGIQAGHYQASTIQVNGHPRFVVAWHVTPNQTLCVNAAAQIGAQRPDIDALFAGLCQIARDRACRTLEFVTLRAGLLKAALARGFVADGVLLTRSLA
jgi:hypothetical protein